tara:strand:+ start:759 stop:947 length:189 start_codon:yes stop_codon:yes gene_type:complete
MLNKPDYRKPVFELFKKQYSNIENDLCATCGSDDLTLKDDLSAKEFLISGMCQKCQDEVFGG